MFGMLLAIVYADAIGTLPAAATETPRATAIDHVRAKPVSRERIVPTDMMAVERATDGVDSLMTCLPTAV